MTAEPRWDTDTRGVGVAAATAYLPQVHRLAEQMAVDGWVTEDADAHLLEASAAGSSPLRITAHRLLEDGTLELDCADTTSRDHFDQFRSAIGLLAVVAECSFHVRLTGEDTIECVTGMLAGDGTFATHGHVIRIHLIGPEPSESV